MIQRLLAPALLAVLAALPCSTQAALPDALRFGQDQSDLKPDPALHFGILPNGVKYVVLPNKEPHTRVSLRLVVLAGSLNEKDNQKGLAHFLEHMAFNGSDHYAPGTLIEFFQRMGMNFGGDTNAHTSFDHTAYLLELPNAEPATLDEGLKVFADDAKGLLLLDSEIEKERGIILSEKRDRDSVHLREFLAEASVTLDGTLLPARLPIGDANIISSSKRDVFADYYNTWYRPDRIAVIAVGDFDAETLVKQITAHFSDFKARTPNAKTPDIGTPKSFKGTRVFSYHENEDASTRVGLQVVKPYIEEPDNLANRSKGMIRDLALRMLNRRLEILARKDKAPFSQGSVGNAREFGLFESSSIELVCKPDQWRDALTVSENELRRALQFGFQKPELEEAAANVLNTLDQAVKTAASRRSSELADEILGALLKGEVLTHPSADFDQLAPVVKGATVEACTAALREMFQSEGRYVTVVGNAKVSDNATEREQSILAALEQAEAVVLQAPKTEESKPFAYVHFGPEGKVAVTTHVADLDVDQTRFENGVHFNFKKTDFEVGKVEIVIRVGGGLLSLPKNKPGLNLLADSVLISGGLGQHSFDDLVRLFAGKTVGGNFQTRADAFVFSGQTNREDLLLQLQFFTAYLTDAGYREDALTAARKRFEQIYLKIEHVPEGPLNTEVPRILANGDTRFGYPPKTDLDARSLEEVKSWLTPEFSKGAIEVTIVGDVPPEEAQRAVAATLGSLPPRSEKPAYTAERTVAFPPPLAKDLAYVSAIPKAYSYIVWPTTDSRDVTTTRQLHLLSEVLNDRLRIKIREELGDAYSPYSMSTPSDTFLHYGSLAAVVQVAPDKTDRVAEAVLAIAKDLIANGVNQDELDRARLPILTGIREAARTNPYWLETVLSSSQEYPIHLDWRRTIEAGHLAITKEQLSDLAKKYLKPELAFRFTVKPGSPAADHK